MFVHSECIFNETTSRFSTHAHCVCDLEGCRNAFVITKNVKKRLADTRHFCSLEHAWQAKKSGNISDRQRKGTCLERYGSELYITQPHLAKEYAKRAWEPEARDKRTETIIERYGVSHPFNIPGVHEAATAAQTPESVRRRKETCEATMLERYGVRHAWQLPKVREAMNTPEAWEKRYQTMKQNGTFNSSHPERVMEALLFARFGEHNVLRHVFLLGDDRRHTVDFHIVPIDTYLQVDGVYYHGLDRPIEVISEQKTKRDKAIYRKWLWDRELDKRALAANVKLIRMTDLEVLSPEFDLARLL